MTPVFVGELNPYGGRPENALLDDPYGSSGYRLRALVCGVSSPRYREFSRHNLCVGQWSIGRARLMAAHLFQSYRGRAIVLLGVKVQAAFKPILGPEYTPFQVVNPVTGPACGTRFLILPHPSGLNHRLWTVDGLRPGPEPAACGLPRGALGRDAGPEWQAVSPQTEALLRAVAALVNHAQARPTDGDALSKLRAARGRAEVAWVQAGSPDLPPDVGRPTAMPEGVGRGTRDGGDTDWTREDVDVELVATSELALLLSDGTIEFWCPRSVLPDAKDLGLLERGDVATVAVPRRFRVART